MALERRSCVRHKVHGPVFASFDGVTGGFILDLSEEGMAMKSVAPVEAHRPVDLYMNLPEADYLETTAYIAWADALGRAGVRFSELPAKARLRLQQWLASHAGTPTRRVPKFTLAGAESDAYESRATGDPARQRRAISLESETQTYENRHTHPGLTVEYAFHPLGSDVPATLRLICERARSLTRGTSAVIALGRNGTVVCRASVGASAPALGARLDVNAGFSGECVRTGKLLRCNDTESDPRVEEASCRRLGIRSILAAPIQYEREIVGLLEVCSTQPFAFEDSDVTLVERLAQTVLLTISQMDAL